jgi:membrane protein involved in colicin uptake
MADNNSPDYKALFLQAEKRHKEAEEQQRQAEERQKQAEDEGRQEKRDRSKLKSAPDRPLSWNSCTIPTTCSPDR